MSEKLRDLFGGLYALGEIRGKEIQQFSPSFGPSKTWYEGTPKDLSRGKISEEVKKFQRDPKSNLGCMVSHPEEISCGLNIVGAETLGEEANRIFPSSPTTDYELFDNSEQAWKELIRLGVKPKDPVTVLRMIRERGSFCEYPSKSTAKVGTIWLGLDERLHSLGYSFTDLKHNLSFGMGFPERAGYIFGNRTNGC